MKIRIVSLALLVALAGLTAACDGLWCIGDNCNPCDEDPYCDCGPDCWDSDRDNDRDEDPWNDGGWCATDADCANGQVCLPGDFCVDRVDDCPLTDECLGDPEGYTPEWMGIDPLFAGPFWGDGFSGRIELLVDFYDDHIYGEAQVVYEADGWWEWRTVVITGTRDGAALWGQIVDANEWERTFDATFEAQLDTASRIGGTVSISSDEGTATAAFQLYRTSPCGCETDPDPDCLADADCAAGQVCEQGDCVEATDPACQVDGDCGEGQICEQGDCVAGCASECCQQADCALGYQCVEGACLNPCVHWCDCAEGEDCIDGYCQLP